jgi:hypothetical protein
MNAIRSALRTEAFQPLRMLELFIHVPLRRALPGMLLSATCIAASAAPTCTWTTLAGSALNYGYTDGTNSTARFCYPEGIVVDAAGVLYVADFNYSIIRKVAAVGTNWVVSTIAGTATGLHNSQDGTNSAASFGGPAGIAVDGNGNLFVADSGTHVIRRITPNGTNWVVTTIAGTASASGGADGTNSSARFNNPQGIAVDAGGTVYVADANNNSIRKITPDGTNWVVTTIAGQLGAGNSGHTDGTNGAARFWNPVGIAVDSGTNIYVVDSWNCTVRKLTPIGTNWVVTTIAGSYNSAGYADGTNGAASFYLPNGVALDGFGNLYVADSYKNIVRQITRAGTNWVVTTIGGSATNTAGFADGTNNVARFNKPWGIAADNSGHVFLTDYDSFTVRRGTLAVATPAPVIQTVGWLGGNITFTWSAVVGRSYQVVYRTNLSQTTWSNLTGTIVATNATMTTSDTIGSALRRFYRVALLP